MSIRISSHAWRRPSHDPESPEVRDLLENLDDAMFAAIAAHAGAVDRARDLWSRAVAELGPDLLEESREQYLRFAAEMTRRFEAKEVRNPAAAVAAIEIIELLTRGV
jgi:hypothetical protein